MADLHPDDVLSRDAQFVIFKVVLDYGSVYYDLPAAELKIQAASLIARIGSFQAHRIYDQILGQFPGFNMDSVQILNAFAITGLQHQHGPPGQWRRSNSHKHSKKRRR